VSSYVLKLAEAGAGLSEVGGKGQALARMAAAGFGVPDGFHITTEAYAEFVRDHRLAEDLTALAAVDADDTAAVEAAATGIRARFTALAVPEEIRDAVVMAYDRLGAPPVAVRSSATTEDLAEASFAGQQDSFLNVTGADDLLDAVRRCWASLWTARAVGYRARQGLEGADVRLAVVVQELVPADAAGVLFTADPVTGATGTIAINAAWGLGEAVVGGLVTPDVFQVARTSGELTGRTVNHKATMTVRGDTGTQEVAVPADQVLAPSLTDDQARRLAGLGLDLEQLFGHPVDVEWARVDDRFVVLQARPITTGADRDPWNDSRGTDYLWTNTNVGEAVPDVMTPATWSLVEVFLSDAMATSAVPPYVAYGRIGGRAYLNLSVAASMAGALGMSDTMFRNLTVDVFGRLPADQVIPKVAISRLWVLRRVLPVAVRVTVRANRDAKRLPAHLAAHPARCEELRDRIGRVNDPVELAGLWHEAIEPGLHTASLMLNAATRSNAGRALVTVRRRLQKLIGDQDTEALLAGLGSGSGELASLGLLVGLERLRNTEIDRATFSRVYGHRGPHEFEVSTPRPGEDPGWIDAQLAAMSGAPSASDLLARQENRRAEAWARFVSGHPRRVRSTSAQISRWAAVSRSRELARSEVIRYFWVLRSFWLRAAELTGVGQDIFCYDRDEVVGLLRDGERLDPAELAARRAAVQRYAALPTYPSLIRGSFDPFRWAADPSRRSDAYLPGGPVADAQATVTGFPGSAGVVEAIARVLTDVADGDRLRAGEVLVTAVTNVGWTPLFPRAAAVVTDVGAPLSHAAIVARELGIPAVVGCGNATMRIATGDRVRVDGTAGTVQVL